jgi:hypothetical protein
MRMSEELSSALAKEKSVCRSSYSDKPQRTRIDGHWIVWLIVSFCLVVYSGAGYISSRTISHDIKLIPRNVIELNVLRLAQDQLRLSLEFERDGWQSQRPELGMWQNPAASIRILASIHSNPPTAYEALPASSYNGTNIGRRMTSAVPPERGGRPGPSFTDPSEQLAPGFSKIRVEVTSVEEPLVGEVVSLNVEPPLGFKSTMPNVAWLWWFFAWPLYLLVQLIWAALLAARPLIGRLFGWTVQHKK